MKGTVPVVFMLTVGCTWRAFAPAQSKAESGNLPEAIKIDLGGGLAMKLSWSSRVRSRWARTPGSLMKNRFTKSPSRNRFTSACTRSLRSNGSR